MSFIIHGLLHDTIDYKKLIEAQAKTPAFEPKRVVGARKKYYTNNSAKTAKRIYPIKMLKK